MTENGGRKVPQKGEGGFPPPPPVQKPTFRTSEVNLRLRIDVQLCFNRAQLVELGLEKLSALKMDHAVARKEVREVPKNTICALVPSSPVDNLADLAIFRKVGGKKLSFDNFSINN